jgi:hypothetical protein
MEKNIIDFEYEKTRRNVMAGKLLTQLPKPKRAMPQVDPEKVLLLVSLLTELLDYVEQIRH